jgi:hypothetical protein
VFREELQQRFRDDEITITPQGQAGADNYPAGEDRWA